MQPATTLLQLTIYNRETSVTLPSNAHSNYRNMFMRYHNLAILATTVIHYSTDTCTRITRLDSNTKHTNTTDNP
jgi:hypothetical protein